jgi:hypothetical protein
LRGVSRSRKRGIFIKRFALATSRLIARGISDKIEGLHKKAIPEFLRYGLFVLLGLWIIRGKEAF